MVTLCGDILFTNDRELEAFEQQNKIKWDRDGECRTRDLLFLRTETEVGTIIQIYR